MPTLDVSQNYGNSNFDLDRSPNSFARNFFSKNTEAFPNHGNTDFPRQNTEVTTFLVPKHGKNTKI